MRVKKFFFAERSSLELLLWLQGRRHKHGQSNICFVLNFAAVLLFGRTIKRDDALQGETFIVQSPINTEMK